MCFRSACWKSLEITPGSTTASIFFPSISMILLNLSRESTAPPKSGIPPPESPVLPPCGVTGTSNSQACFMIFETSSVVSGIRTTCGMDCLSVAS